MVDANDLLVACDDARFYGGDALGVSDGAAVHDIGGAKAGAKGAAGFVIADGTEGFHARAKRGEIGGNVAGATEAFTLGDKINDGNSGFGREARSGAPEVAVEHEIAKNADALVAQARDQAFEARDGRCEGVGHRVKCAQEFAWKNFV